MLRSEPKGEDYGTGLQELLPVPKIFCCRSGCFIVLRHSKRGHQGGVRENTGLAELHAVLADDVIDRLAPKTFPPKWPSIGFQETGPKDSPSIAFVRQMATRTFVNVYVLEEMRQQCVYVRKHLEWCRCDRANHLWLMLHPRFRKKYQMLI